MLVIPNIHPIGHRCARPSAAVLRRRRTVAVGVIGVLVLSLWAALHAATVAARGGPSLGPAAAIVQRVVVVKPGETLWSIAEAVDPHGDVRPLVARLFAEVGGRPLQVGERVAVP